MHILVYTNHPTFVHELQTDAQRYTGLKFTQADITTTNLNFTGYNFIILAPVLWHLEAGLDNTKLKLEAWLSNIHQLIETCQHEQIPVLLLSSDLVFASQQTVIEEVDTPNNSLPLAQELIQLEKAVALFHKSLILRIPPCLSSAPKGGLAQLLASQSTQAIFYRGLQTLDDLARVLLGIILQIDAGAQAWGLYHYAGLGACDQATLLSLVQGSVLTKPSFSPINMPCEHLLANFGVHPRSWQQKIPQLLEQLHDNQH